MSAAGGKFEITSLFEINPFFSWPLELNLSKKSSEILSKELFGAKICWKMKNQLELQLAIISDINAYLRHVSQHVRVYM